ncbi:MAG TPA: DUF1684 domain-containing protein [Flavisolibacter sp.]|nr:DUF1684 domain-containing protein [Flavisolibacter sp.]
MIKILIPALILLQVQAQAQTTYTDSAEAHIRKYVEQHEVVKDAADKKRLQFFSADPAYRVLASFEKKEGSSWFEMKTSGSIRQLFRVYGVLHFKLADTSLTLNVYQSQGLMQVEGYKTYLFLPFTDGTTGNESYEVGRYIDLRQEDIRNGQVYIDFNKAYNPYCAYASSYSCPIPPKENNLPVRIMAGEKKFASR